MKDARLPSIWFFGKKQFWTGLMMPFVKWLNLFFSLLSAAPLPVPFPLLSLPCGLMKSHAGSLGGINLWQFKAQFRWSDHVVATGEVKSGDSDLVLDEHLACHVLSQPALSSYYLVYTWIARCQPSSWVSVLSPHVNCHANGWSYKTMEEMGYRYHLKAAKPHVLSTPVPASSRLGRWWLCAQLEGYIDC